MRIYIAAPYTKGDVAQNVRGAIEVADKLLERGHYPYVPHLTHFWHFISPKSWGLWLDIDRIWIAQCEALLRLPGESVGADNEVAYAKAIGIPIYWSIEEIKEDK